MPWKFGMSLRHGLGKSARLFTLCDVSWRKDFLGGVEKSDGDVCKTLDGLEDTTVGRSSQ